MNTRGLRVCVRVGLSVCMFSYPTHRLPQDARFRVNMVNDKQ